MLNTRNITYNKYLIKGTHFSHEIWITLNIPPYFYTHILGEENKKLIANWNKYKINRHVQRNKNIMYTDDIVLSNQLRYGALFNEHMTNIVS